MAWIHRRNGVYEALVMCRKFYPWRIHGYLRLHSPIPIHVIKKEEPCQQESNTIAKTVDNTESLTNTDAVPPVTAIK